MNNFEDQLKRALGRVEPPPDFTQKVLERLAREAASPPPRRHLFAGRWMAAAAAAVLLAGSGVLYQHHERELQGEAAKQQLLIALHIAGAKLQQAQQHVQQVEKLELN